MKHRKERSMLICAVFICIGFLLLSGKAVMAESSDEDDADGYEEDTEEYYEDSYGDFDDEEQEEDDEDWEVSSGWEKPTPRMWTNELPQYTEISGLNPGKKLTVFSAPSKSAIVFNKTTFDTGYNASAYGRVDDWMMIRFEDETGNLHVGYILITESIGVMPDLAELQFTRTPAYLTGDSALHEAPRSGIKTFMRLDMATQVMLLSTTGNWAYVQTQRDKKTVRGFVPLEYVCFKGRGYQITDIEADDYGESRSSWGPDYLTDGNDNTAWKYYNYKLNNKVSIVFSFKAIHDLDHLVIKNGLWRVNGKNDEYISNQRIREMQISFRYAGSHEFVDTQIVALPDLKGKWQQRADGIYIDLTDYKRVTAIRITPKSVYKGKNRIWDLAVSQITIFGR